MKISLPLLPSAVFLAAAAVLPLGSSISSAQEVRAADARDPSEMYFRCYQAAAESEKLEKAGDFNGAAGKIVEANLLISRIRRDHPDWKPEMVAGRVAANAAAVERIRPRLEAALSAVNLPGPVEPAPAAEGQVSVRITPRPQMPKRKVHERWEDPFLTNEYFEKRNLFDTLLRNKTRKDQVTLLCKQFGGALERLDQARDGTSPQLKASIAHERERLAPIADDYLASPLKFSRVRLWRNWMDSSSHEKAARDFRLLLGGVSELAGDRPDFLPGFGEGVEFFNRPFLCPLGDFIKQFEGMKGFRSKSTRVSILMPGFPKDCLYHYPFDGDFTAWAGGGGKFNRMSVITDSWDQVVGLQFSCQTPSSFINGETMGVGVFDLLDMGRKGTRSYKVVSRTDQAPDGSMIIATMLRSPDEPKEINILHLPAPTVALVRYCLEPKPRF